MNIIYSTSNYPKLSESFILNEICELESRGHNVAVFAHADPMESTKHAEIERLDSSVYYSGPPEISAKCGKNVLRAMRYPSFYKYGDSILNPPSKLFNAHILSEFDIFLKNLDFTPDVIHSHFATVRRLPVAYAARKHNVPVSIVPHAFGLFANPNYDALETLFDTVNHIVSPTEYNKRYIEQHYLPNVPISVVPAVSQLGTQTPAEKTVPNRILTVGRFVEKKGYPYAIKAVAEVARDYPEIEYHIIGEGDLEPEIRSLICKHELKENVEILQQIPDDELSREYDEAAIFLLPCVIAASGDRDAAPVVLKEAMTMGTACISTTVSAIPELITDDETGLLVPPRDVSATADAITSLLADPDYREELAAAGRKHVTETLTPEKAVDELEEVFNHMVSNESEYVLPEIRRFNREEC